MEDNRAEGRIKRKKKETRAEGQEKFVGRNRRELSLKDQIERQKWRSGPRKDNDRRKKETRVRVRSAKEEQKSKSKAESERQGGRETYQSR